MQYASSETRASRSTRAAAAQHQRNALRLGGGGGGCKSTPSAVPKPERGDAPGFCALRHLQHPKSQNAKRTALAKTRTKTLKRIHIHIAYCSHPQTQDQLRDHTGKKRRYWLVLKEITRAAPCFFSACVGMVLVNNISARKKSRREVGSPGAGRGHRPPNPAAAQAQGPSCGQVGPPGPHPAQPSSSVDPGGERRPIRVRLS
jgi:hypothetical protein